MRGSLPVVHTALNHSHTHYSQCSTTLTHANTYSAVPPPPLVTVLHHYDTWYKLTTPPPLVTVLHHYDTWIKLPTLCSTTMTQCPQTAIKTCPHGDPTSLQNSPSLITNTVLNHPHGQLTQCSTTLTDHTHRHWSQQYMFSSTLTNHSTAPLWHMV
jgi:hypothetical protein